MPLQFPWETEAAPAPVQPPPSPPKPRGRRPVASRPPAAAPYWLYHHLIVSGPADGLAGFTQAARGSGVTPWLLDSATLEEDVFNLAASQPAARRTLTIEGCRILARQFRDRVEARQARAAALAGHGSACPFDLQVLLPIPPAILALGPTHAQAQAWLVEQWGVPHGLRQVAALATPKPARRLPDGHGIAGYSFFTGAGETPRPALTTLQARWPSLRLDLRPRPG